MIDFRWLIKAGTHFGHQTSRWSPKMASYIWGHKNGVHLIDVSKTAHQLEKAAKFLESISAQGKSVLWVGTKKPAQAIIYTTATHLNMPYVNHRWIGGTLNNYAQVKKSVTRLLHFEDIIDRSEKFPHYTKKELNTFSKVADRLKKNVGGIRNLSWPVGALVIVDVKKERSALKEAASMKIPVIALVDTNSDPSMVDYVIPGNDDAPRAIKVIVDYLIAAVEKGIQGAAAKKQEKKKEKELAVQEEQELEVLEEQEDEESDEVVAAPKRVKKAAPKTADLSEDEESDEGFEKKKERSKPLKDVTSRVKK